MIKPINKPYCHKILPLVYDDSLSYYEVLCKLINKINEIINQDEKEIGDIITEWLDLHLSEIMLQALYNENERTIYLTRNEITADGDTHTYNVNDETMIIGKR